MTESYLSLFRLPRCKNSFVHSVHLARGGKKSYEKAVSYFDARGGSLRVKAILFLRAAAPVDEKGERSKIQNFSQFGSFCVLLFGIPQIHSEEAQYLQTCSLVCGLMWLTFYIERLILIGSFLTSGSLQVKC